MRYRRLLRPLLDAAHVCCANYALDAAAARGVRLAATYAMMPASAFTRELHRSVMRVRSAARAFFDMRAQRRSRFGLMLRCHDAIAATLFFRFAFRLLPLPLPTIPSLRRFQIFATPSLRFR